MMIMIIMMVIRMIVISEKTFLLDLFFFFFLFFPLILGMGWNFGCTALGISLLPSNLAILHIDCQTFSKEDPQVAVHG